MKVHIASDFHLDHTPGWTYTPPADAQLNLIPGDISEGPYSASLLKGFGYSSTPHFVAGNHEFYHWNHETLLGRYMEPQTQSGCLFMEGTKSYIHTRNDEFVIFGCTLWTDFDLFGVTGNSEAKQAADEMMNDYRKIRTGRTDRTLKPADTEAFCKQAVDWLNTEMAQCDGYKKKIVMTHHAPSFKSVAPQYMFDALTPAFASGFEWLMLKHKPVLWAHGHVHSSFDYMVGDTRVVCNPRGYPISRFGAFENANFNPNLIIEI